MPPPAAAYIPLSLAGAMLAGVLAAVAVTASVARRQRSVSQPLTGDKTPLVPTDAKSSSANYGAAEGESLL